MQPYFYKKLQLFVCTLVKWVIGYRYREIHKKAGNCMKEPRRFKEDIFKKTSSIKTLILLVAIALVAGLFIWLQIQPDPTKETVEKEPIAEEANKEVESEVESEDELEKPTKPEGTVTYESPKSTPPKSPPPKVATPDVTKPDTTLPAIVEERVNERDQEAILASALPNVYTVYTDSEQGSGFLYSKNGDIVTNAHVVDGNNTVTVMNNTGQQFVGKVIGISDTVDVALIRVEAIAGKEPMVMDLMKSTEGTSVIAIGSPNNKSNTATTGKITATGRSFYESFTYTDLYEMDASIAPGSSGGPLLDALTEKVIGINSIILTDYPNIGYSIPMYSVHQLLKSWQENPLTIEDPVAPHIHDAFFEEDLLTVFIEGYTTLYTYAQNEVNFSYLEGYLLPGSAVYNTEKANTNSLLNQQKSFTVTNLKVEDINNNDDRALVTVIIDSVMTLKGKEATKLKEQVVYEVIIDEYGDYMIKAITKVNLDTVEATKVDSPAKVETPPEETETETEGTKETTPTEQPKKTEPQTESVEEPKTSAE